MSTRFPIKLACLLFVIVLIIYNGNCTKCESTVILQFAWEVHFHSITLYEISYIGHAYLFVRTKAFINPFAIV